MKRTHAHMTEEEAYGRLIKLERRRDLYAATVGGVSVWRLVRKEAMTFLQGRNADIAMPLRQGTMQRLRALGEAGIHALSLAFAAPRRALLAVSYGHMVASHLGKLEDPFIDALLDTLPGDYFKVGHAPQTNSAPLAVPPDISATCVALLGHTLMRRLPEGTNSAIQVTADALASIGMESHAAHMLVQSRLTAYLREKTAYAFLLRRIGARLALVPYSEEFGLSAAAAEAGVPVLEVVHGFITTRDPDFLTATERQNGGTLLPRDAFIVQGTWWRDYYAKSGFYPPEAFLPIGNRTISRLREQRRVARQGGRAAAPLKIVLGMPGIGSQQCLAFVAEALQNMRVPYHLHVRLHPRHNLDVAAYAPQLEHLPPQCVTPTAAGQDAPGTPELLVEADWHVSSSSSCHLDALALGVPTAIIPGPEASIMQPLYDLPGVVHASAPCDLADALAESAPQVPAEISHAFCMDFSAKHAAYVLKDWMLRRTESMRAPP